MSSMSMGGGGLGHLAAGCRFNGVGCDQQSYVGIHMQVSFGLVENYD